MGGDSLVTGLAIIGIVIVVSALLSQAAGSVRVSPDEAVAQTQELRIPKEAWLIAYCA